MIEEKIKTSLNLDKDTPVFLNDVIRYVQNNNLAFCMTEGLFNSFVFTNQNGIITNWDLRKPTLAEQSSQVLDKLNNLEELNKKKDYIRVSEKVLKETESLDDFILKIIQDGTSVQEFKIRFNYFKQHLKEILPDVFIFDVLKMEHNLQNLNKIRDFVGYQDFLAAIEFELEK